MLFLLSVVVFFSLVFSVNYFFNGSFQKRSNVNELDMMQSAADFEIEQKTDMAAPEKLSEQTIEKLDEISEKYEAVSVQAATIQGGRVTHFYSYGYADAEKQIAADENTVYRVASLSKPIVAMTVMKLYEEGKLDIDKDISDYLGFKVRNPKYPDIAITSRMLMTHTSSLLDSDRFNEATTASSDKKLRDILKDKKAYTSKKPGTTYSYTNLGIAVLACTAECAAGESFSDMAEKFIFDKTGSKASFIAKNLENVGKTANAYKYGAGLGRSADELMGTKLNDGIGTNYHVYQGSLMTSATGYAEIISVLLNDGVYGEENVLSDKSVRQMLSEQFSDGEISQCLCLQKFPDVVEGKSLYGHTGNAYGIFAGMVFDNDDKSGVVVITSGANAAKAENGQYDICSDIMRALYNNGLD